MILPFPVLAQSGLLDLVDQHFERGCQFCVACPNDGIKPPCILCARSGTDRQRRYGGDGAVNVIVCAFSTPRGVPLHHQ